MDAGPRPVPVDLGIEGIGEATKIGEGGFGIVYRARQEAFGRTVAVKMLRAPGLDPDAQGRFDHECQAIGSLSRHPHVVAVYTAGTSRSGQPYLVMEYLPKGTLAERLSREGPLESDEVVEIGIKLADALAAAHDAGVLHRDLKPENVLISAYGEPQLVDFGVARIQGGTATRSGIVTGTLAHAAPEVLSGQRAGEASDVYSLASTLYALLAGQAPFVRPGEETFHPLLARVLGEDAPDLRPAGVPPALCGALERALAKDPAQRTPSASALAEALEATRDPAGVRPAHRVALAGPAPAPAGLSGPGDGTVVVSGVWARPPAPPPAPAHAPVPLLDRFGSKGKAGLVGGGAVLVVAVVVGAVVLLGGGGRAEIEEVSSGAASTTVADEPSAASRPDETVVPDNSTDPTPVSTTPPTRPPPVPPAGGTAQAPSRAIAPPLPAPPRPPPPPPPDDEPAELDYPLCTTGEFQVTNQIDPTFKIPMRQETCVEEVSEGRYKASVSLSEVDETSDDTVEATYRVELRRCEGGDVLSSDPRGSGDSTAGGTTPVFSASTREFSGKLFAHATISSTYLTTAGDGGGESPWSGGGLDQYARQACT